MEAARPPFSFAPELFATRYSPLYCALRGPAAAGAGGGVGADAEADAGEPEPLAPNSSRVGLRSRLFTARLISASVRRPSAIRAPERLSKSSASSRIDCTV